MSQQRPLQCFGKTAKTLLLLLEVGACGLHDLEEQMILLPSIFVNRKDLNLRALKASFSKISCPRTLRILRSPQRHFLTSTRLYFCSATIVAKSQEICRPILKSKPCVEMLAIKCIARPQVVGQIVSTSVPTLPREAFVPFVQFTAVAWFPTGFFLQACGKPIKAEISAREATQHKRS